MYPDPEAVSVLRSGSRRNESLLLLPYIRIPLIAGVLLAGCENSRPSSAETTPVDTGSETDTVHTEWTLSDVPLWSQSSVAFAEDSIPLYGVPSATFFDDGSVLFAITGGSRKSLIRVDEAGRVMSVIGRAGAGPHEFADITGVYGAGTLKAVWDYKNGRVSWISREGTFVTAASLTENPGTIVGILGDSVIVSTPASGRVPEGEPRPYFLAHRNHAPFDTVYGPPEPTDPVVRLELVRPFGTTFTINAGDFAGHCFARPLQVIAGDRLVVADNSKGLVLTFNNSGSSANVYTSEEAPLVTDRVLAGVRQKVDTLTSRFSGPPTFITDPNGEPYELPPAHLPPEALEEVLSRVGQVGDRLKSTWNRALVAGDGTVWLERASCYSDDPHLIIWDIVAMDRGRIATLKVPEGLRLLASDGQRVIAVQRDSFDVEHVAMIALEKSAAGARP